MRGLQKQRVPAGGRGYIGLCLIFSASSFLNENPKSMSTKPIYLNFASSRVKAVPRGQPKREREKEKKRTKERRKEEENAEGTYFPIFLLDCPHIALPTV